MLCKLPEIRAVAKILSRSFPVSGTSKEELRSSVEDVDRTCVRYNALTNWYREGR